MTAVAYRPEIDGLRAIAVGTVVLFHAGLGIFPGGFIGVDVFFVISGYLITSVIARELATGTFSLLSFYERRIRRIFPALLVVVGTCLVLGAWRMSPGDYDRLAESALAAIGFHSNFYFADDAGYFMPATETMPLLHTWSLGVEEQFYVIAPLLLIALWRTTACIAPVFGVLSTVALALSLWGFAQNSDTAFYFPHTRAIELMIGMALGLGLVPAVRSRHLRQTLSVVGLALIIGSAVFYDSSTPFPGAAALVPCIGSALIIHCTGQAGAVGGLLSTSPAIWLGRISYSLYLWHWPIFAFAAYEWGEIDVRHGLALVAAAVMLSAITYRWIEQPARTSQTFLTHARVYAAGLGSAGVLAIAATAVAATDGWPTRLEPEIAALEAHARERGKINRSCRTLFKEAADGVCRLGDLKGPAAVLVWGDSHSIALAPQFDEIGKSLGISVLMIARGGCPPLLEDNATVALSKPKCSTVRRQVSDVLQQGSIRHVVIAARWGAYTGRPLGEAENRKTLVARSDAPAIETHFASSFKYTVDRLLDASLHVTLIGPVPELPVNLPSSMMKALMRGQRFTLSYDFSKFLMRQRLVLNHLAESDRLAHVDVIYPDRILCPLGRCRFIDNGIPVYRDDDHLNLHGGNLLKASIAQSLAWLDSKPLTRAAD